jgi:hypothetical protein
VAKVGNIKITGLQIHLSLLRGRGSAEPMEKVGTFYMGIVKYVIRLRCFLKHKLKDTKGKEEEEVEELLHIVNIRQYSLQVAQVLS